MEAQASTQPWEASRPRGCLPAPTAPHAQRGPAGQRTGAAVLLTRPRTLASSHSGCQGCCCRPGSQAEAEAWRRLGRPPACSGRGPVWLSSPGVPPTCPAPLWGQREAVGNLSINLSAWGLLVRWCLSGLCSCQMGLPEPVGEGGRREPLLQGLEAASPSLAFTSPPPRRGPPSLPHQDTEHCMNSGLNGIISEFWSTANSGYFTNYLSLLCGGQSLGPGAVTDAGRPGPLPAGPASPRPSCCSPAQWRPRSCGQMSPVSAGGSGPGQGLRRGAGGQALGWEGWTGERRWGKQPGLGSTLRSTPCCSGAPALLCESPLPQLEVGL